MLKSVIFDLDNTLYDYDEAHGAAWRALCAFAGEALGLTPEAFNALHGEADRLLRQRAGGACSAIHNRLIRYQLMLELLGRPIALAAPMARLYWTALLAAMRPTPDAVEVLDELRGMGLRVGIGTNMTAEIQFAKLERLDMLRRVDFIVTSEEVGAEKPDARLFDFCVEKAGCPAAECAFVGDSLKGDVLGASRAGLRAVWYCPSPEKAQAAPDAARVACLAELPGLLATY